MGKFWIFWKQSCWRTRKKNKSLSQQKWSNVLQPRWRHFVRTKKNSWNLPWKRFVTNKGSTRRKLSKQWSPKLPRIAEQNWRKKLCKILRKWKGSRSNVRSHLICSTRIWSTTEYSGVYAVKWMPRQKIALLKLKTEETDLCAQSMITYSFKHTYS